MKRRFVASVGIGWAATLEDVGEVEEVSCTAARFVPSPLIDLSLQHPSFFHYPLMLSILTFTQR